MLYWFPVQGQEREQEQQVCMCVLACVSTSTWVADCEGKAAPPKQNLRNPPNPPTPTHKTKTNTHTKPAPSPRRRPPAARRDGRVARPLRADGAAGGRGHFGRRVRSPGPRGLEAPPAAV